MRIGLGLFIALAIPLAIPAGAEPGDRAGDRAADRADDRERAERTRDFGIQREIRERSEFQRAIERAPHEAREQGERERAERARREADATRREAGLDRSERGRISVGDRTSVGVDGSRDHVEVNVRSDWDPD